MSLANYTALQTAISEWLAREQDTTLIARIPDFITIFEANANRELQVRQMEDVTNLTVSLIASNPERLTLPTDFQSMIRARLSGVTGKPRLQYKSKAQLDDYVYTISNISGQPRYFTIWGSTLELAPVPGEAYVVELFYRKYIPALASNSTNWLLTLAPDAYLYGSLLQSAPYIKNDERVAVWATGYKNAIDGLNNLNKASEYNSGPPVVTTSGPVF